MIVHVVLFLEVDASHETSGPSTVVVYTCIIIVILRGYHVSLRVAISYMMLVSRIIAIAMIRLFYLFNACYYCLVYSAVCMLCFSLTHFLSAFLASHLLFAWVCFIYFFSLTRFLSSFSCILTCVSPFYLFLSFCVSLKHTSFRLCGCAYCWSSTGLYLGLEINRLLPTWLLSLTWW